MAEHYSVTSQTYETDRQPDGTYEPVVAIGFTTKGDPSISGIVRVPQSLLKDKVRYAETVKAAIEQAVGAHLAVNEL